MEPAEPAAIDRRWRIWASVIVVAVVAFSVLFGFLLLPIVQGRSVGIDAFTAICRAIGILPGLGNPAATLAILLPLTLQLPPTTGLITMAGIYHGAKFAGANLEDVPGDVLGEGSRFGAGALGIGKNVKISERTIFDESERGRVIGLGFTWKSGDDIGTNGGVCKAFADKINAARIMFHAVPAMHGGEDAVGGGL